MNNQNPQSKNVDKDTAKDPAKNFARALNQAELEKLVEHLQAHLVGAQLQDIFIDNRFLLLSFYLKGLSHLVIRLDSKKPQLGLMYDLPFNFKKQTKPILLFLRSHAKNLRLNTVTLNAELGRVVVLQLQDNQRACEIELRLIPNRFNIIVRAEGKQVSLLPVRALPQALGLSGVPLGKEAQAADLTMSAAVDEVRWELGDFSVDSYLDAFASLLRPNTTAEGSAESDTIEATQALEEKKRQKQIQKKTRAIQKNEDEIVKYQGVAWGQIGEHLKVYGFTNLPQDWASQLDFKKSIGANIEKCFLEQKRFSQKILHNERKILHLKEEIAKLRAGEGQGGDHAVAQHKQQSPGAELLQKAQAKGRKMTLSDGVDAIIGKSAKDNLAILRKAQAWDLWLHLRDYPGAHAVIRRPKNQIIPDADVLKVAKWLVEESLGREKALGRFDVAITEVRFVKPIKGDKLGRVTFHNERNLTLHT